MTQEEQHISDETSHLMPNGKRKGRRPLTEIEKQQQAMGAYNRDQATANDVPSEAKPEKNDFVFQREEEQKNKGPYWDG